MGCHWTVLWNALSYDNLRIKWLGSQSKPAENPKQLPVKRQEGSMRANKKNKTKKATNHKKHANHSVAPWNTNNLNVIMVQTKQATFLHLTHTSYSNYSMSSKSYLHVCCLRQIGKELLYHVFFSTYKTEPQSQLYFLPQSLFTSSGFRTYGYSGIHSNNSL